MLTETAIGDHVQCGDEAAVRSIADSAQRLAERASAFVHFGVAAWCSEKPNDPQGKPVGFWEPNDPQEDAGGGEPRPDFRWLPSTDKMVAANSRTSFLLPAEAVASFLYRAPALANAQ